jgi:uncharacterized protein (TIGR00369 family)
MTTSDFRHQPERALEQIRETTDSGPAIGIELARTALASQPFSVLLGCRLAEFSRGGVALELDVREELRQHHGYVHGGAISYLMDNAIAFAAGAILGPDVITGGFTIDYLRPATGTLLTARAETVRAGSAHAVVRCDVFDLHGDGPHLCATGQGRVMVRSSAASPTLPSIR